MKRRSLFLMLGLMSLALFGCGKQEVVYNTESTTTVENGEQASEQTTETATYGNLKETLGIGEETNWKETLQMSNGSVDFKTSITVPETKDMYTVTATEYYLTSEDKKKIAEYFMDADSIRVDKDAMVTKEALQNKLHTYEQAIGEKKYPDFQMIMPMDSYEKFVATNFPYMESPTTELLASYEKEVSRLTEIMDDAPAYADLDELSADYSADAYKGKKNDVEYSIFFFGDEERNRSAWSLQAVDMNHFLEIDVTTTELTGMELGEEVAEGFVPGTNLCQLTPEEAKEQAKGLCEDLGLYHMTPVSANVVQWDNGSVKEINGYFVKLVRQIEGVAVDSTIYMEEEKCIDGENVELPYSTEIIEVCLNDKGIISVLSKGMLKQEQMSEPVKLLGFAEVQEVIRQELKSEKKGQIDGWQTLDLSYIRVESDGNENQYTYIPAWRLRINRLTEGFVLVSPRHYIWINAIDGSRIDMVEDGTVTIVNAFGMGDYE